MSHWHISAGDIGGIVGITAGIVVTVERRIGVIRRLDRLHDAAVTAATLAAAAADDARQIRSQIIPDNGEPCLRQQIADVRDRLEDHIKDTGLGGPETHQDGT